jgi:hypothetical protein
VSHLLARLAPRRATRCAALAGCMVALCFALAAPAANASKLYCQTWVPAVTDCANIGGGPSTYANGIWDENVNEGYYFESSWYACESAWSGSSEISDHCTYGSIGSGTDLCPWYEWAITTSAHAVNGASTQEYPVGDAIDLYPGVCA